MAFQVVDVFLEEYILGTSLVKGSLQLHSEDAMIARVCWGNQLRKSFPKIRCRCCQCAPSQRSTFAALPQLDSFCFQNRVHICSAIV